MQHHEPLEFLIEEYDQLDHMNLTKPSFMTRSLRQTSTTQQKSRHTKTGQSSSPSCHSTPSIVLKGKIESQSSTLMLLSPADLSSFLKNCILHISGQQILEYPPRISNNPLKSSNSSVCDTLNTQYVGKIPSDSSKQLETSSDSTTVSHISNATKIDSNNAKVLYTSTSTNNSIIYSFGPPPPAKEKASNSSQKTLNLIPTTGNKKLKLRSRSNPNQTSREELESQIKLIEALLDDRFTNLSSNAQFDASSEIKSTSSPTLVAVLVVLGNSISSRSHSFNFLIPDGSIMDSESEHPANRPQESQANNFTKRLFREFILDRQIYRYQPKSENMSNTLHIVLVYKKHPVAESERDASFEVRKSIIKCIQRTQISSSPQDLKADQEKDELNDSLDDEIDTITSFNFDTITPVIIDPSRLFCNPKKPCFIVEISDMIKMTSGSETTVQPGQDQIDQTEVHPFVLDFVSNRSAYLCLRTGKKIKF